MKRTVLTTIYLFTALSALPQIQRTDTVTDRTHHLQEVTVTETRQARAVSSTVPLHILAHEEMALLGITDMADALHRLPGITLRDYGGAGGMKTVSVRGFGAKHTGVSYDGVMLSDCQSGEIDLSRYSLENVDQLSLIVGDHDDIFIPARQASMPAMLAIRTIAPPTADHRAHLTTQVKIGSYGFVSPFVRYGQNLSDRFAFSFAGEYTHADNHYPYMLENGDMPIYAKRENSRMDSGHGEMNFIWNTGQSSRLIGKIYYYDNDRQLPGPARYYTTLSGETLRDRNFFAQLQYQKHWNGLWSLRALTKFNWASSIYKDALYPGGVNDASYWQRETYGSLAVMLTPTDHWAFDYSVDYAFNNLNGNSWRTVVGRPYRHSVLQSLTAKFRHHRLTVLGRLLYSVYLNENKGGESARNMRRLSPSLSLSYQLMADHEFYVRASYKNIFRSPTFNESYYFHYGSTNLLPETTDQLNIGLTWRKEHQLGLSWQVTLDGYYNHVKDMIVAVPYNMFVWTCINVGKVQVWGLDATLRASYRWNERHRLTLTANYSYQKAEDRTNPMSAEYGHQIPYIPLHTGAFSLGYENPWLNIVFHGLGVTDREANLQHYEGTMVKGYADFGLTFYRSFSFGRHRFEGRFDIKNLFDAQYEIVGKYPMPGRHCLLSIQYQL